MDIHIPNRNDDTREIAQILRGENLHLRCDSIKITGGGGGAVYVYLRGRNTVGINLRRLSGKLPGRFTVSNVKTTINDELRIQLSLL